MTFPTAEPSPNYGQIGIYYTDLSSIMGGHELKTLIQGAPLDSTFIEWLVNGNKRRSSYGCDRSDCLTADVLVDEENIVSVPLERKEQLPMSGMSFNKEIFRRLHHTTSIIPLSILLLFHPTLNWTQAEIIENHDAILDIQEYVTEFSIEENCPIGTVVGIVPTFGPQISSNLPNVTDASNNELRFKLGSSTNLFAINDRDGILTTKAPIDAEWLCQKADKQEVGETQSIPIKARKRGPGSLTKIREYQDRITCSQEGRLTVYLDVNVVMLDATLKAVHHLSIQIQDVDDNFPEFRQTRWHRVLKEALYRKGKRLDLPRARDADLLPQNRRILYRLQEDNSRGNLISAARSAPFRLDVNPSGQPGLVLTDDLDAEIKKYHKLVLIAYSALSKNIHNRLRRPETNNLQESRLEIEIEVEDMNDNEPRFDRQSYNLTLPESTIVGSVIYQLSAQDPDSTSKLVYSLGATEDSSVAGSVFIIESDGRVRLRSPVDYERRQSFTVPIRVSDGEFEARTTLFIQVEDVNDEPPEFEINPHDLVVDENVPAGKLIGRVHVHDRDSQGVNGRIKCTEPAIFGGHQALSFHPDPAVNPFSSTYDLRTRTVLDRENAFGPAHGQMIVYLVCSDGNDLTDADEFQTRHTSTMTATLKIRDMNDCRPVFSRPIYHAFISENNAVGEKIVQVNAIDPDYGENARIIYSLLDRVNFRIDPVSGWIMSNVEFDREIRDSYQVTVIATDQGNPSLSSSVLLNLTIKDKNDHRPRMISCADPTERVDTGFMKGGHQNTVNFFVARENSLPNTYIGDIVATDDDVGENGELSFQVIQSHGKYKTIPFTVLANGSIYTRKKLDREERSHYLIPIRVSDRSSNHPLTSTGTICIVVQDANDNVPMFVSPPELLPLNADTLRELNRSENSVILYDQPVSDWESNVLPPPNGMVNEASHVPHTLDRNHPTIYLSMHEAPEYPVTTLKAKDLDSGENGRISYQLNEISSNKDIMFRRRISNPLLKVESQRGVVSLAREMTAKDLGSHIFEVTARDNGAPSPNSDTKLLLVLVKDVPPMGNTMEADFLGTRNKENLKNSPTLLSGKSTLSIVVTVAISSILVASFLGLLSFLMCYYLRKRTRKRKTGLQDQAGTADVGNKLAFLLDEKSLARTDHQDEWVEVPKHEEKPCLQLFGDSIASVSVPAKQINLEVCSKSISEYPDKDLSCEVAVSSFTDTETEVQNMPLIQITTHSLVDEHTSVRDSSCGMDFVPMEDPNGIPSGPHETVSIMSLHEKMPDEVSLTYAYMNELIPQ
ncbi:unnamed protein product [Calicophoron daubneyi]|uniref:Cadherin domain-containing protein n=1 Tax=Calicophoron daubneyi TaxID=300641 RepID=A0AAV2TZ90_CALDB